MNHDFSRFALILLISAAAMGCLWAQPSLSDIEQMIEREQYDLAEAALQEIIDQKPKNAKAYYWLGAIYYERSEYDVAASYFRKGIKSRRREPLNYVGLGEVFFAHVQKQEAVENFEKALRVGKKAEVDMNIVVAMAYLREGDPQSVKESVINLRSVSHDAIGTSDYHLACGKLSVALHDSATAMYHFQQAIEADSSRKNSYIILAEELVQYKKIADAHETLAIVKAMDSTYPPIYRVAGFAYMDQEQFDAARLMMTKYYDLTGHDRIARPVLGETLFLIKDYRGVVNLLESRGPYLSIENRLLAMTYGLLGEIRLSKQHLDMCFKRLPTVEALKKHRFLASPREKAFSKDTSEGYKYLADMAKENKQYELEATFRDQYIIQKQVAGRTGSLRDYYYAGIANFRAGKPEKADSSFIQVLNIKPDFTAAHFWRIRVAKAQDPENEQWLVIPHAQQIIKYIGEKPIKDLKAAEKAQLRTCYQLMTVYQYAQQADGSGNCEAARPWLEKALVFTPEDEYLLGIRANCQP